MLPEKTIAWGESRSCIRELAEYGAVRKKEIGPENVFDFSIGNPSIPAPDCVNEAITELVREESSIALHGYTTAAGNMSLRMAIAADLNKRCRADVRPELMYITVGAAAALTISLRAILLPGEEVIAMAPFFPEYRVYTEGCGGVLVTVPPREDFQINLGALESALTEKTKALIINSPNNPSGVILSAESIRGVAALLRRHREKTGNTVYIICDEPYRELVYDGSEVPCVMEYYPDTLLCYSFSKSLSIPGERIGYVCVNSAMENAGEMYSSILGAGRCLGYVNPPSLFQRVVEKCIGKTSDISRYKENRDILCAMLRGLGYECIEPQGAFYLFVKALEPDARSFSEKAKKHELLLVPSDDFGCPGYVRIAYCVSKDMILRSAPAFRALMEDYKARRE